MSSVCFVFQITDSFFYLIQSAVEPIQYFFLFQISYNFCLVLSDMFSLFIENLTEFMISSEFGEHLYDQTLCQVNCLSPFCVVLFMKFHFFFFSTANIFLCLLILGPILCICFHALNV